MRAAEDEPTRDEPIQDVPSLDGRTFVGVRNSGDGEVDASTVFTYHQDGQLIWAEYAGGPIVLGRLVGTRDGDLLTFRYVHASADGTTSGGRCTARLERLPDGRLRSPESWSWESRAGSGSSVVEEEPRRRRVQRLGRYRRSSNGLTSER